MKIKLSTIISLLIFTLCGMGLTACLDIGQATPQVQAKIDKASDKISAMTLEIEKLTIANAGLYEKYKAGDLSSDDLKEALKNNKDALGDAKDSMLEAHAALQEAKSEGATTTQLLWGAIGGAGGRTLLHGLKAAVTFMPGQWGVMASQVFGLLLGGSGGLKGRKEDDIEMVKDKKKG